MVLQVMEVEYREWINHNFPDSTGTEHLLGAMEELGELSHAHLKGLQGIRLTPEEVLDKKRDAVGDIIIYLAGYCYREGFTLTGALERAWDEVKLRDWQKNRKDGVNG